MTTLLFPAVHCPRMQSSITSAAIKAIRTQNIDITLVECKYDPKIKIKRSLKRKVSPTWHLQDFCTHLWVAGSENPAPCFCVIMKAKIPLVRNGAYDNPKEKKKKTSK